MFFPVKMGGGYPAMHVPLARSRKGVYVNIDHGSKVAKRFLEAVQDNPDGAWAFVSKAYAGGFDLDALREVLPHAHLCRWVRKAGSAHDGATLTRSLYLDDPARDLRKLVHLRMIREPDRHGVWKICAIEQEDCARGL